MVKALGAVTPKTDNVSWCHSEEFREKNIVPYVGAVCSIWIGVIVSQKTFKKNKYRKGVGFEEAIIIHSTEKFKTSFFSDRYYKIDRIWLDWG